MKVMKSILTVLIALFAVTANAQTASALVAKYKGQDGVKSEDMMADVKRMVDMFAQMPAQGGGGMPGMPDMSEMAKSLKSIKTYTVLTPNADKVAAIKADIEAMKDYKSLIEFVQTDGGGGMGGFAMPEPKVGADGVRRLQLPNMFQQQGGSMQAYAKVTDNKFNEVIFFTTGQQNALSYVEAADLTVDNLMMIMMIPRMRNMGQGGGFGGGF